MLVGLHLGGKKTAVPVHKHDIMITLTMMKTMTMIGRSLLRGGKQ